MNNETPKIGMGASWTALSDITPGTVIDVRRNGREIDVQKDDAKRVDTNGMSEDQDYTFSRNTDGDIKSFSLRADGRWIEKGQSRGYSCSVGEREKFYDYTH